MRKREDAAKAAIMHARWAAMRRRRMKTYPVLRRTVAVALSEALIAGSQDDPAAGPPCGATMTRATPPMTMAVSAPMTQAASRSVAAAASAVLGARGVVSVTGDANLGPRWPWCPPEPAIGGVSICPQKPSERPCSRRFAAPGTMPAHGWFRADSPVEVVLPALVGRVPSVLRPRAIRAAAAVEESRFLPRHEDRPRGRRDGLQRPAR